MDEFIVEHDQEEPEEGLFRQEAECAELRREALDSCKGMSSGLRDGFNDLRAIIRRATRHDLLEEAAEKLRAEELATRKQIVPAAAAAVREKEKERLMEREVNEDAAWLLRKSARRASGGGRVGGKGGKRKKSDVWVPGDLRIKLVARKGQRLSEGPSITRINLIKFLVNRKRVGLGGVTEWY